AGAVQGVHYGERARRRLRLIHRGMPAPLDPHPGQDRGDVRRGGDATGVHGLPVDEDGATDLVGVPHRAITVEERRESSNRTRRIALAAPAGSVIPPVRLIV